MVTPDHDRVDEDLIRRALISVYDKGGLETLVEALAMLNVEVVASSGTAAWLRKSGYGRVIEISEYTGFPEAPDGLLKTLHPKIHGGLLLDIDNQDHRSYMERQGIEPIDLVVVNLYPFEEFASRGGEREAAMGIDIGGPALMRAAAKAALLHGRVAVVVDPSQYQEVAEELKRHNGDLPRGLKRRLAAEAFRRTSDYDAAIYRYLSGVEAWGRR
jgi:phosphoribosylaminoimidazolecarboxamide formyltransferase/IMP cyclohydrolase